MKKKWIIRAIMVLAGFLLGFLFFGLNNSFNEPLERIETNSGRWSCAMHPHVSGEENGTCPLCAMDLVYMSDDQNVLTNNQIKMSEDAIALANIQTTVVGTTNQDGVSLKLSGRVTSNRKTDAVQTILFDGRIDAFYPNYIGKRVRNGQEIGKVFSPELYVAQDKLLSSVSYKDTHKSLYESARNTLGLWKLTDEQIDKIIAKGEPIMNFPLSANVSGTVTEVLASEGNYYQQGDPLYRVSDLRSVWVVLDAYEEQLPLLKLGQEVELRFTGLPSEVLVSKVSFIEPIMQKNKHALAVRVEVKNDKGQLKLGMFAEAQIIAENENKNSLSIPKSAVLWTGKRSIVYRKLNHPEPIFELVEVELGQSFTNNYEVISGLNRGDEIVTHGSFTIDAAAQLLGKTSMMNKPNDDEYINQIEKLSIKDNNNVKPLAIEAKLSFETFLETYFELKDALVATDYKMAQKKTILLNEALKVLLQKDELNSLTLKDLNNGIKKMIHAKNINSIRKEFKSFSQDMTNAIRSTRDLSSTIYVQFCPMADKGKGASWLSLNKAIENPYFGDIMLHCGQVTEEIN